MSDEPKKRTKLSSKRGEEAPRPPRMLEEEEDATWRLLCQPFLQSEKDDDTIPFHLPHKRTFTKEVEKRPLAEPLTGFKEHQRRLLKRKLPLPKKTSVDLELKLPICQPPICGPQGKPIKDAVDQNKIIKKMRKAKDSFIYLQYAVPKSSELYTPYTLKIVNFRDIKPGEVFLTMSSKGFTTYVGNEMHFTSLDEWETEYNIYCTLMRIRTFFNFRIWKAMYVWRKNIIHGKFKAAQHFIENNLFVLNANLRQGLLDVQNMCYNLVEMSFTDLENVESLMLSSFMESQLKQLEKMNRVIFEFREEARELVFNACHGALIAQGFVIDERQRDKTLKKLPKTQQKPSYIEQAGKKKFCARLSCYINLMDYIIITMLHQLVTNSITALNNVLRLHTKSLPTTSEINLMTLDQEEIKDDEAILTKDFQNPMFYVNVILDLQAITLDPSLGLSKHTFQGLFDLWFSHTTGVQSLLSDSFFQSFTTPVINNKVEARVCGFGPSLAFYLSTDNYLITSYEACFECLTKNYEACILYIQKFEYIFQFYVDACSVKREDIKNETDLETFRLMCTKYHDRINIINQLTLSNKMGLLELQFSSFKETALPEATEILNLVESVIPGLGRTKVLGLNAQVNDAQASLGEEPINTLDIVRYLEYIASATAKVDQMELDLDYCKELYDIMEEFQVPVTKEDMTNYLGLSVTMSSLRNHVDKKIEETGKIMEQLISQINKDITAIISEAGAIKDDCKEAWLYDVNSVPEDALKFLEHLQERLLECMRQANEIKNYQKQFRIEVTRFDILDEVMNDVKLRLLLWESQNAWSSTVTKLYTDDFNNVDVDEIGLFIAKNVKNINLLDKGLPSNLIVPKLRDEVELLKDKLPVISYLRNSALRPRHWAKIEVILNTKFELDKMLTLEKLEKLKVFKYATELMEVSGQASSEAGLEALLRRVEEAWKNLEFIVLPYKDIKGLYILGSLEDIQAILDESNINVITIAGSRHVGPIKDRVDYWVNQLELFSKTIEEWVNCQQNWLYLEVIFSAPDIQRQLPNESRMFLVVDKSWKEIMRRTAKMPLAMDAATQPGLLDALLLNNSLLEQILECLESYLETKRVAFPRFYFLSNDELLDILAQTRNPHAVQPHLRKCFDAIARIEFGVKFENDDIEENLEGDESKEAPRMSRASRFSTRSTRVSTKLVLTNDIVAMLSPEGERVVFGKGLKARGNVEDWLGKVEESMFKSLKRLMRVALNDYVSCPRTEWVLLHANQIILTVSQIMWAKNVHRILDVETDSRNGMIEFEKKCIADLNDLAAVIRSDLSAVTRKVLIALITIDVHARDTVHNLVEAKVDNSNNFEWLKVLRYYWQENIDDCVAKMSSAFYVYGYEYLGASGVLVITPLTDRCYLCLMGALQLDLGGAPAGPAGTGKTETTKDLAKALAIQCVVFNCSEGLDYKMMGRFFSGLAQSGAWCCFDEFNRIDIEVLSVIAQQLITIRNAKAAKLARFMFEGREIKLVQKCAAFITMNPGYAGRTELPDNLKALFRPISMMVPDYALIAEVVLYSEGFESSRELSQKMVQMYKLCSEQLSQQDHYDFGMRAVKSVLVMAGSLKRANPSRDEDVVLICALRDSNLPKFLADDAILFQGILGDLFPGIELPTEDYGLFEETIIKTMREDCLQPEKNMVSKIIQLYETMIVRWGVMLVGPTGGGKTTILNSLGASLTQMFKDHVEGPYYKFVRKYVMNPKAVTAGELYGEVNPFTIEWHDGLMGIIMRQAVNCLEEEHQWIICDGPVDAVWIENLNTVLDDNKMLCLANSERIKLTQWVHMVFEVQDLAQASPATVSRCGMVYVDSEQLKWLPYVKSWIERSTFPILTKEMKEYVLSLFEKYVEVCFEFIKKNCTVTMAQVEVGKVAMMCALFDSYMSLPGAMDKIKDKQTVRCFINQTFIVSLIWSLGGNLVEDSREEFEVRVRDLFDDDPDSRLPGGIDLLGVWMNSEEHRLETWSKITPNYEYNPETPFFETLVPTNDTVRFGYIMERLLQINHPVLVTGDTGVGKSVIAKDVINRMLQTNDFVPVSLIFSVQTSSSRTQEIIESKLEKKKKTLLGAPYGKRVIIFVDDVNMPKLETYGAQPPIELLRQLLDYGGLYDRDKLYWKQIVDVCLMAACAPPGGGRNPLTPRFLRHFGILLITPPGEFTLKMIFRSIVNGFLKEFANQVRELGDGMVYAAIDLYNEIAADLLPTPAKSHYVFNLRDLSKCIQGVLQADSGTMREAKAMQRLFYHECLRVFHDRLTDLPDKIYFYNLMKDVCFRNFGTPVLEMPDEKSGEPQIPLETLLYGDFMRIGAAKEDRLYEEITDVNKLKEVLQDYLDDYNLLTSKEMNLIFFMDAVEHCLRLARVLRSERGNALLVGVGGMGKQSLTRLASHLNSYKCFQIELTRSYDHDSFFEDLRRMYMIAGAENSNLVFLFTDTQIVHEDFLEDINNILNSGEVPNLFEAEEMEKVLVSMRDAAKSAGIPESSRDAIYEFFISRTRSNLHLVLCMSPVGDSFRRRCRMFPSLVNCCTIDWFEKWPQEALLSVAENSFKSIGDEQLASALSICCVSIHETVENMTETFYEETRFRYYTTPSSYLELIRLYKAMLVKRKEKLIHQRSRIQNGLTKLYETNTVIDSMKQTLVALEPELASKGAAVAELMKNLSKEQKSADKVRSTVKTDEEAAKIKAGETQVLAADAQKDLDTAMPAMEAATKALKSLNKNDINELKVFQKPPKLVQFVMEAICTLLSAKTDWASAKIVLGDTNFLKKLQDYDKDHISEKTLKSLATYIAHPDFIPEKVAGVSKACKSMCMWARAIDQYAKVYKVVEPKRKRLEAAELELNEVLDVLREKQRQLVEVEEQIAALEKSFNKAVSERDVLEANINLTSNRLNRAGRLNIALSDEQVRWEESVRTITSELEHSVGDVLKAAACVAYLGAFTSVYRQILLKKWENKCEEQAVPSSDSFSLINVLSDPYTIRQWNSFGLPRDVVSTENAIFVTEGGRWPLMIDPQEQANRWIRKMEAGHDLKIIKLTDENFMQILENAIRLGMSVLLEEVGETLDPTLGPILSKQVFIQGGRPLIRLGDTDVDYDENFRFFITTKLANPHYLPEICIQATLVNFTVTPSGLEEQLLADVVRLENPGLEEQRSELVVRINNDKSQLAAIEEKILYLLYHSEGNILDDEVLIETLNESKEASSIIAARLLETETTEESISKARELYRSVATRGSVLFFVVAQLAEIDPMYQYSLNYFQKVFTVVIRVSPKSTILEDRLQILYREITLAVYTNVSRGLFERHKLVYSFMLCAAILKDSNIINESQWDFLLRGPVSQQASDVPEKPSEFSDFLEQVWASIHYLSVTFDPFKNIKQDILSTISIEIGDYQLNIQPPKKSQSVSSTDWNKQLSDFEKMLLIKTLCEEKLVFAITAFVKLNLGKVFIESPQISLQLLYKDTSNTIPLVFVLSTGSDPFGAFQRFAAEMGFSEKVKSISLGQGQGPVAEKLIHDALDSGGWVFLQNCHLATSWMLSMERIILKIGEKGDKISTDFRLFMSSMPSKAFPVAVLQNSVKVTNEPPKGLRANMKRAFTDMSCDFFEEHPLGHDWQNMLFGICMFHAIIQERKKFGPLGWNIIYEFNDSDREFAFNTIRMYCEDGEILWDALEYLTGEITYGGRVTDYWDLRCLKTILKIFFAPKCLKTNYVYSMSGTYYCPEFAKLDEYKEFIEHLPLIEDPEIFGMHENANIAFQIKETHVLVGTIMESQPRGSSASAGRSSDEIVYELADMVLECIKPKIIMDEVYLQLFKTDEKGRLPSLTTVLVQEIDRYNILLQVIHSSMGNLKKAIKGLVLMSDTLEEAFKAFLNNKIPKLWSNKAYNSLKTLGSWVKDLVLRLDFISIWLRYGHPTSYWISGFYFPQGFLTGTLQTHARKYNLPIDKLKFDFVIENAVIDQENVAKVHQAQGKEDYAIYEPLVRPSDGVLVHGIFIDAGRWKDKLVDAKPGEINPPLPVVLMIPKTEMPKNDRRYVAPVYKTSVRAGTLSTTGHSTNFVLSILLPSDEEQSYWILKGTALLTQISN